MSKAIRVFGQEDQFLLDDGTVNAGGALYIYQAGTTTPLTTYQTSDTTGATNGSSMTLDSAGRLQADVYITQAAKFIWKNSAGTQIGNTIDNIASVDQLWTTVSKSSNYTTTINDLYKTISVDASGGSVTIALLAAATAGAGYIQVISKTDSSANTVVLDPTGLELINGSTTYTIYKQNESAMIMSTGTAWVVVSTGIGAGLTIPSGSVTLTSGDLTLTAGNETITAGNLTLSDGTISVNDQDSRTATVNRPLTVGADTTGTPATGIGTGMLFNAESADESPSNFGAIEFCASDVTAGSEDTYLDVLTRVAGAALTKVYRFIATGAFKGIFTHANTADRTYTLPNSDVSQWVVQYQHTQTGAVATGTTAIPFDNTIPQITEGNQYMTLAITPKLATNRLRIDVCVVMSNSNASMQLIAALFQDATANALASCACFQAQAAGLATLRFTHEMAAGTTSATTFIVRAGGNTGATTTFNGYSSTGVYGGVLASSITITEYSA